MTYPLDHEADRWHIRSRVPEGTGDVTMKDQEVGWGRTLKGRLCPRREGALPPLGVRSFVRICNAHAHQRIDSSLPSPPVPSCFCFEQQVSRYYEPGPAHFWINKCTI
ncbi:unnamed protein product, partial [Nesidiocoris tenuis]